MRDLEHMMKRQQVLAEFGEFALDCDDLDRILTRACCLVGEALGTKRAKIIEIRHEDQFLLLRAGVGWAPGVVGSLRLPMGERSSETYAIAVGEPVIMRDLGREERFDIPTFMKEAGVTALVNVPIFLPGKRAYGLLQVDGGSPQDFGEEDIAFLRTYATILGPVIDRLLKLRELRASEERFRLTVESALDYAIYLTDPEDRITDWLPGAASVFGWTAEEVVGQRSAILFVPEDRESHEDGKETGQAAKKGVSPNVRWHICKDGTRVFIEGSVRALHDPDGTLCGFLKIGQDVTERRRAEGLLRESEERFRQFGEASSDVLWIRDAALRFEYVSPAFETVYGESRDTVLTGDTLARWAELIHPDDRDRALSDIWKVRNGEPVTHQFRIVRPSDGDTRWIEDTVFPLFDETGQVRRVGGIAKDVTAQKMSAARLEVLVAELQHRSRNLLGVISALASRTIGQGGSVEAFQDRLQALSRAMGLLSRSSTDSVALGDLVRAELAAHTDIRSARVAISGPKVQLASQQVQNFALALHELATNAMKYGALQDGTGHLTVAWSVQRDENGHRRMVLTWTERGVEMRAAKEARRGYGRELIENALSYALRAKTEYRLGEDGVHCRIELPLG